MDFFKNKRNIIILAAAGALLAIAITVAVIFFVGQAQKNNTDIASSLPTMASAPDSSDSSSEDSSSTPDNDEPKELKLSVTAPGSADITVNAPTFTVKGSADPAEAVLLNGKEIKTDESGFFSETVTLVEGENTITLSHKGEEQKFTVRYKKLVIKSVSPSSTKKVESEDTLTVSCTALKDSTVTATFNGKTITLYADDSDEDTGEYISFVGSFKMPLNTGNAKSYGKITFKAVSSQGTETKKSGDITVKQYDTDSFDGGNGYPKESLYLNVGKTHIAEVIADQAETYSASDATDRSRPTNNYLPKGTVDFCSPYVKEFTASSGKTVKLVNLRYGNRLNLLSERQNVDIKIYEGTLPDTNKLNVASYEDIGRHTLLTLDVDWKAPFRLEIGPQKYKSTAENNRDYTYTTATYNRVDITFCYGEELTNLPDLSGDPLFSSCEVIKNEHDITLRLHLREKGVFYGWSAEYNDAGQLCFKFLKPAELKQADNEYGYSLEGVKIVIDAGHGGRDNGAGGFKKEYPEDVLNLTLAKELEAQLKALGATVIMTRTDDSYVEVIDRFKTVWNSSPDLVISIHRNSSSSSTPNSFTSYHFNAYTKSIAEHLLETSLASGVYKKSAWSTVRWHYFFLSRVSDCPSVLTENGYMSNKSDYNNMVDPAQNKKSAAALTKGIMNYFISIQSN